MIDETYISNKIAQLRIERNISARDLSLSIGQNHGYITAIENKKSLPSMQMFLYICEYLKVSPKEFFDESDECSPIISETVDNCKQLTKEQQEIVLSVAKGLNKAMYND